MRSYTAILTLLALSGASAMCERLRDVFLAPEKYNCNGPVVQPRLGTKPTEGKLAKAEALEKDTKDAPVAGVTGPCCSKKCPEGETVCAITKTITTAEACPAEAPKAGTGCETYRDILEGGECHYNLWCPPEPTDDANEGCLYTTIATCPPETGWVILIQDPKPPEPPPVGGPPPCQCDSFVNGLDKEAVGKHACMQWHKNNPFLDHIKEVDPLLPKSPGKGYQTKCSPVQDIRHGHAEEFEKEWQGNCMPDAAKCRVTKQWKPTWQQPGAGWCGCDLFKNGAHPEANKEHLCVTAYPGEDKQGKPTETKICTPPSNGYEERFGESLQNYGCDHPAAPCNMLPYIK